MKKISLTLLVFFLFTQLLNAQSSILNENMNIESKILNKKVNYAIYLPPGYDADKQNYPVLYLLHGYSDNHTGWVQYGMVQIIADRLIKEGTITPMIIVMPDGEVTWYVNDEDKKINYEDFFIKEFIPNIEKMYAIRNTKEFRSIAGLSMGGNGALLFALKYPDTFTASCPLSAAVFTDDEILQWSKERAAMIKPLVGTIKNNQLGEQWKMNSALEIIKKMPEENKRKVKFYIDCGDDDFLYKGNAALHVAMRDANIIHEFRIRDGGHTWTYWRTALAEVLEFVSNCYTK